MSAEILSPELVLMPNSGRRALGKLLHWRYRLFQQKWHDSNVKLEHLHNLPFVVLPGILNPRLARSGKFFASQLTPALLKPRSTVLDMRTGSGLCAIAAALLGCRVIAVDINPAAVRCAQVTSLINSLEHTIQVLQGDSVVSSETARIAW